MFKEGQITVPAYQRAYSWETSKGNQRQVNTFLSDLEDFAKSGAPSYYFGHFLFAAKGDDKFDIVDGQQRLTTIVIFLSALFARLRALRPLSDEEKELREDMVKRNSTYRFAAVDYDNSFFKEFVVDQTRLDTVGAETVSAQRLISAFEFFKKELSTKDEAYLTRMLRVVADATCSTHSVKSESDAVQMFIFQNNRGKRPSHLEIIKAQFMYNVHIYGNGEREELLAEIKAKFENIYKAISHVEANIDEDDVLLYTLRVYYNDLNVWNALDRINKRLAERDPVRFIREFTRLLSDNFRYLQEFFGNDQKQSLEMHSLIALGGYADAMPFVLKAYQFAVSPDKLSRMCGALESMVLRHRLIGTRADLTSRINGVYKEFTKENPSVEPIIDRIDWMKTTTDWWWAYWNNHQLESAIQGWIEHGAAKYLLWKYENHLRAQGKSGYAPLRFDDVASPDLEHIAPQTPTDGKPVEAGYPEYDEEFKNLYIDCLGNYLLLSGSHNRSLGNRPFADKRASYVNLLQQQEVREMTKDSETWSKEMIANRKAKLIRFILETL